MHVYEHTHPASLPPSKFLSLSISCLDMLQHSTLDGILDQHKAQRSSARARSRRAPHAVGVTRLRRRKVHVQNCDYVSASNIIIVSLDTMASCTVFIKKRQGGKGGMLNKEAFVVDSTSAITDGIFRNSLTG